MDVEAPWSLGKSKTSSQEETKWPTVIEIYAATVQRLESQSQTHLYRPKQFQGGQPEAIDETPKIVEEEEKEELMADADSPRFFKCCGNHAFTLHCRYCAWRFTKARRLESWDLVRQGGHRQIFVHQPQQCVHWDISSHPLANHLPLPATSFSRPGGVQKVGWARIWALMSCSTLIVC